MLKKFFSEIGEIVGNTHEVTESIREALADRLTSPLYGYFALCWFAVNWNYLYSAFFISGDHVYQKFGLLKNEYLLQEILPPQYNNFSYWWDFLVLPFLLTCVVTWFTPFISRIFYQKHIRNKVKLEEIKNKELAKGYKSEAEVIKAQVAKERVKKEASDVWKEEFEEFITHPLFGKFQIIIDSYYKYNGGLDVHHSTGRFIVPQDILVYSDVNGLITRDIGAHRIVLTEKGKEFTKLFMDYKQSRQ